MIRTMLIVDDSLTERIVLKGFLSSEYNLIEAASGEEALELLRANSKSISAILLDIVMTGMDGFETLREIRSNDAWLQIPVIITTGLDDEEAREKAIACGASSFVTKPFNRKVLMYIIQNAIALHEAESTVSALRRDAMTGLLNRESFFAEAEQMIRRQDAGCYMVSFIDIDNFKVINDRFGADVGDSVLKHVAGCLKRFISRNKGLACRYVADTFIMLYLSSMRDSNEIIRCRNCILHPPFLNQPIRVRIGHYLINDPSLPISSIYDRAALAANSIKGRYDVFCAEYDDEMREKLLHEQRIINEMAFALENGEFVPWFQPQYNHVTGALIGAEALVRWQKDGKTILPNSFIPIFERNGFIYEVDKYVWRQVCVLLRRWLDEGKNPLPVSVNISRYDLFQKDFINVITNLIAEYKLPSNLLRLEITESAFSDSTKIIVAMTNQLIEMGLTVEIDDFGSGYSSLNTLKDVPASILKLDMRFFEATANSIRGGSIIESVVRMAKWLGMAVIAEGVEDGEQADYLESIGCYYIQGYYYDKPMPADEYEQKMLNSVGESKLPCLETIENLDNNLFWNPRSMETLIFNSYVGGACIFEYHDGIIELLRINKQYISELHGLVSLGSQLGDACITRFLDESEMQKSLDVINNSIEKCCEADIELKLSNGTQTEYIRINGRIIARSENSVMCYAVIHNLTEQRVAEQRAFETSQRIQAILDNTVCGITAYALNHGKAPDCILANDRFYELIGYTKEQFLQEVKSPLERIHPDVRAEISTRVLSLKKIGDSDTIQVRAIRRDNSIVWLRADVSIVEFDDIPRPVQLTSFLDISKQMEAERQHAQSMQRLEAIMSNISGSVSAVKIDERGNTTVIFCNDQYYTLFGYTREQAEAIELDVMSCIVAEDYDDVVAKLNQLKRDGNPIVSDYRAITKDGHQIYVRSVRSRMSMNGYGDDIIVSVETNITEKRTLEDQLRALIDNINGGVSATYLNGNSVEFLTVNDRFYELIGYTKTQFESEINSILDIIHPDDRKRVENLFHEAAENPRSYTMEYRIVRRNGAIRHILCNTNVIHLFGIDAPVQLAISTDITVLRNAQHQEHETMNRLQKVMSVMSDGISAVAFFAGRRKLIFANDRYFEMHGIERITDTDDDCENAIRLIHSNDKDCVRNAIHEANQTGETQSLTYRVIRNGGEVRWFRATINVTTLFGIDAPVQVSVFADITAEHEAYAGLSVFNASIRNILSQSESSTAIRITLMNALDYFKGDRAYIVETDIDSDILHKTYEECGKGIVPQMDTLCPLPFLSMSNSIKSLNEDNCFIVEDSGKLSEECADIKRILAEHGLSSIAVIPLINEKQLIGFLGIDNIELEDNQTEQLMALSDYISILMARREQKRHLIQERETIQQLIKDTPGGFLRMAIKKNAPPTIADFNDNFCRMLGMTPNEVFDSYGSDAAKCLNPDDIVCKGTDYASALAKRRHFTGECRLRQKDGSLLKARIFGRFVSGSEGAVFLHAYLSDAQNPSDKPPICRDITDFHHDLDADIDELKRNLTFELNTLLNEIPSGVMKYSADKGNEFAYINRSFIENLGYTPESFRTKYHNCFRKMVYAEDREYALSEISKQERDGRVGKFEYRIEAADGTLRWFHDEGVLVTDADGKQWYYVTLTDITDERAEKERLHLVEEQYRIAARHSKHTICRYDISAQSLTISDEDAARLNLHGTILDVPQGCVKRKEITSDCVKDYLAFYDKIKNGESTCSVTFHRLLGTSWRWLTAYATTILDSSGKPVSAIISYSDVTDQRDKEAVFRMWQKSLENRDEDSYTLFRYNLSKDAPVEKPVGKLMHIGFVSSKHTIDEQTAEYAAQYVYPEDADRYLAFIRRDNLLAAFHRGNSASTLEYRECRKNNKVCWLKLTIDLVEYPNSGGVEAHLMYEDIDARKRDELSTIARAESDPLTGVLNRATFASKADFAIKSAKPGMAQALLILDLDGFKQINDTFGHGMGDQTLIELADEITTTSRADDLLGRLGGDEFLILLSDIQDEASAALKARQLCEICSKSLSSTVQLSASVGIAIAPQDGNSFEELYSVADKMLYRVKEAGKDGYALPSSSPVIGNSSALKCTASGDSDAMFRKVHRMLIVDDNEADRLLLTEMFKNDFRIEKASGGDSALTKLKHYGTAISVILINIKPNETDAFELLKIIQHNERTRSIPVIMMIEDSDRKALLNIARAGTADYVTKPIDSEFMRIRVQAVIEKAKGARLRENGDFLSRHGTVVSCYKSALERSGIMLITLNWINGEFSYSPLVSKSLAGKYDGRSFWQILLSDSVASTETVQKMQILSQKLAEDHDSMEDSLIVQLKAASGELRLFEMNIFKEVNDYCIADKLLFTLREIDSE